MLRRYTLLSVLVFAGVVVARTGVASEDRARAEGAVILEMLKGRSNVLNVLTIDLPNREVSLIRQLVPQPAKILRSTTEAKSTSEPPGRLSESSAEISVTVIEIDSARATILAGTALIGLSGSRDRFLLKKQNGRWVVIRRDRNYEVAQNASNQTLEPTPKAFASRLAGRCEVHI